MGRMVKFHSREDLLKINKLFAFKPGGLLFVLLSVPDLKYGVKAFRASFMHLSKFVLFKRQS